MTACAPEMPAAASVAEGGAWLTGFVPRRWLRNPHLQTVAGNYLRRDWHLPPAVDLLTPVADPQAETAGYSPTRLLSLCHWQPEAVRRARPTVVLLHGLEGSARSKYVLGNAMRAWAAGCNVVRMNMRSCGGSDALAPTIYHSGRSGDVAAVVDALVREQGVERIALVGYSMGGNLVLKYAGERFGSLAERAAPRQVRAIVGVSPLMDLAASSAALHEAQNRVYEWKFLRAMKRRLRAKAALFPALYGMLEQEGVYGRMRSLRDFDQEIVARYGGFRDAEDYYYSVASSRYAASLRVPTLVLHSIDDPFIRLLPETRAALAANPSVDYVQTEHGGHCAFLTEPSAERDTHWAEHTLLRWLQARV